MLQKSFKKGFLGTTEFQVLFCVVVEIAELDYPVFFLWFQAAYRNSGALQITSKIMDIALCITTDFGEINEPVFAKTLVQPKLYVPTSMVGELSSDFGALLLRETILHSGLIEKLSSAIHDKRHQSYVDHSLPELLVQRILQIACGCQRKQPPV